LHGVLLLDKPRGWTSNDALQKAKGMLRAEKAGHTGTLDPLATGLLPLCFGAATKFSQVSLDADKSYRATLQLGARSTTGDLEGELIDPKPVHVSREQITAACAGFTGEIDQLPPMHSALKKDGKALYEYARAGVEVERTPRRVRIHAIDMVEWDDAQSQLVIDVRCSKGTYIRTLAEDIGAALGCGAHLAGLRRTASGPLSLDQALTLEQLQAMGDDERLACLQPPELLLADWPALTLEADEAARLLAGMRRRVAQADAPCVRVHGPDGALLGTAHITAGQLIADRLLSPPEVAGLAAQRSVRVHPPDVLATA
jgi:tRNA pseudouridine55 synthase